METEVKSVSLTSTDWAAIDAHAKDMATNRSHALRLIIKEWAERKYTPIQMTAEQHAAERAAGQCTHSLPSTLCKVCRGER